MRKVLTLVRLIHGRWEVRTAGTQGAQIRAGVARTGKDREYWLHPEDSISHLSGDRESAKKLGVMNYRNIVSH